METTPGFFRSTKNKKNHPAGGFCEILTGRVVFCFVADGRLLGKRLLAENSFLFVPEKETKRARRSDAAAAGWGCGPRPRDAATLRRPTQVLEDLSKEKFLKTVREGLQQPGMYH